MATTTSNTYVGDGSAVLFSFTFPYINEDDIYITLDGIQTTEYTLANATTVEFNDAPASGVAIRIFRLTDIEEVTATFFPGSAIRAQDLNSNFEQTLYVAQEVQGNSFRPDGVLPMVGNLNLGGFDVVNGGAQFNKTVNLANNRITNVAAPVDSTDAVNRAYVDNRTGGNTEIVSTSYVYYTATQGDTVLTSNVSGVPVFAVSEGLEQIYVNGALQQTNVDYVTNSTSQITFTQPLLQDDVVAIHCINNVPFATTIDADEVVFTYPGGVQQTVQARLEQRVSVKDFGATGDGVTDDTDAIQAAIDSNPGELYVSPGIYRITKSLLIRNPLKFRGSSFDRTTLLFDNMAGKDGITFTALTGKYQAYHVTDLTIKLINGNGSHGITTPTGLTVFYNTNPTYYFERLRFVGETEDATHKGLFGNAWDVAIRLSDSNGSVIRDVEVYGRFDWRLETADRTNVAFKIDCGSSNPGGCLIPHIDHCFGHYCGVAIELGYRVSNPKISNSQFHRCWYGIYAPVIQSTPGLYGVLEMQCSDLNINCQKACVYMAKSKFNSFVSVRCTRADGGWDHGGVWFGMYFEDQDYLEVIGFRAWVAATNAEYTGNQYGLYFQNCKFCSISNGVVMSTEQDGMVTGITLNDSSSIGISGVTCRNVTNAISVDSVAPSTPQISISSLSVADAVTNNLKTTSNINVSRIVRDERSVYQSVDASLVGLVGDGETTLTRYIDNQVKRLQFNSGSVPYTHKIRMMNTDAEAGDSFVLKIKAVHIHATVPVVDQSDTLLIELQGPGNWCVEVVFTGTAWVLMSAVVSLD